MSSIAYQKSLKIEANSTALKLLGMELMTANTAAAGTYGTAVATAERFAELVPFQRQQASIPPTQIVVSAPSSLTSAGQFSGKYAICAKNAAIFATVAIF